jgi:peptidoglycan/LPS O-acetylase OafA/YrhL
VSIVTFYARRAQRILLASVVLVATMMVSSQLYGYLRINEVMTHVTWASFGLANRRQSQRHLLFDSGSRLGARRRSAAGARHHLGLPPAACRCRCRWMPVRFAASWIGLAAVAIAAATYSAATPFPGYHALLPVLGTVLILAGGIEGHRYGASLVLDRLPLRWIGDVSYSLYLWHWPILVLPLVYLQRDLLLPPDRPGPVRHCREV